MDLLFSIIVPVYNRPKEIEELLNSLVSQSFKEEFEVIIVDDGSKHRSDKIAKTYTKELSLEWFYKDNTGAGDSRNFGMKKAKGNYFVIFDSDCIIPENYLSEVSKKLKTKYTDAYGGADKAHQSFSIIQKAINYSMTSFLTTGGIRGNKKAINKFQPRSFNFGISKKAFEATKGFSDMQIGEDIDLTFRIWQNGFETQFIENAFVYHKRRSTFTQFFNQTFRFGQARPILNKKYPGTGKITYWFPSIFLIGFVFSTACLFFSINSFFIAYLIYLGLIFIDSLLKNKSVLIAVTSVFTTIIQFFGYGIGFLRGLILR